MSVRVVLAAAIAFVGIVSIAQIARAETDEERQACTDAAFKVCNEAIPDRDRVYKCLVKKVNQLNPLCQKAIRATMRTGTVQR